MTSNDDIDELRQDTLGDEQNIVPLPPARYAEKEYIVDAWPCSSSDPSPQHKNMHVL